MERDMPNATAPPVCPECSSMAVDVQYRTDEQMVGREQVRVEYARATCAYGHPFGWWTPLASRRLGSFKPMEAI